jgi:Zn-dependent peptidase ImmA (M78 family)
LKVNSIDDWKSRVSELPPKEYGWMEWQANCLAGLILVPAKPLSQFYEEAKAVVASVGLTLTSAKDAARDAAFGYIAKAFDVSSIVIERRVDFDQLQ